MKEKPDTGQQFEYAYDDIGNQLLAREGGDQTGSGLRQPTYVPNSVNQYSSRSINVADRKVDIMGLAPVQNGTATSVTTNYTPWSIPTMNPPSWQKWPIHTRPQPGQHVQQM